ncbi:MAG: glycosyltransferase family 4 protein [Eubacteriales bacterium]
MKIAMIGHKRIPSREGGVEIVVEELATRMVELGHEVTVYNRKGSHVSGKEYEQHNKDAKSGKKYKGIRIVNVPTFQSSQLNAIIYAVLATIHAICSKYDAIHIHAEGPAIMCGLTRLFRKRTIVTIHGLDWQRAKWGGFATKMLLWGERTASKYADEIIVLSENVQQYFKDTYGRETTYVPNGITIPENREADLIEKAYSLEKDSYLLFLARIVPEKGLHYLIESYGQIHTDKKLVIAGGSSHTDDYFEQIQEMARQDERIIMTGFIMGQALEELYSNAYVYVLPSDVEGMPLSLLEAMSYGNCVLVSDISECREVVGENGYYFAKGNVLSLKAELEQLLANEDKVRTIRGGVADEVAKRFNWDEIVEETLRLYL